MAEQATQPNAPTGSRSTTLIKADQIEGLPDLIRATNYTKVSPFRPHPGTRRAPVPSTRRNIATGTPNLQKIVRQTDQLPLGRHFLQAAQQERPDAAR